MYVTTLMVLLPLAPIGAEESKPIEVQFGVPDAPKTETPSVVDQTPFSGGVDAKPLTVPSSSYADVMERVKAGERVVFDAPLKGFPGAPGTYDAWLGKDGRPMMERRAEVVAARPFDPNPSGTSSQEVTGRVTTVPTADSTATPRPTNSGGVVRNTTPISTTVPRVERRGLLQLGGTGTSSYQCYSYG